MTKLWSACFSRLRKDRIFWLAMLGMTLGSVCLGCLNYQSSLRYTSDPIYVEDVLFNLFPMVPFVCAGFISLHLGTEFDENTIRNKLIVGHTKTQVFFASYLTCMAASLLLLFGILLFSSVTGYFLFRKFLMDRTQLMFLIVCCVLCTMVFSAICVAFSMNVHKKAACVVLTVLFMFGILFLASYLEGALLEAEMVYDGVTISMDGVQFGDLVPNPAYVGGTARTVMEWVFDMLPTGQAIQMNNMTFDRCLRWPWLSVIMLAAATLSGYLPFRNRDIR